MASAKKKKKLDDKIRAERVGPKRVVTPGYDGEARPHIVLFRTTAEEYLRLRALARKQNTSLSQAVRDLVF